MFVPQDACEIENELAKDAFFSEGCIFTFQVPLPSAVSLQGVNQRRLYNNLMKDYHPLERPVVNDSHSLTVQFGLSLMQIIDVVCKYVTHKFELIFSSQ